MKNNILHSCKVLIFLFFFTLSQSSLLSAQGNVVELYGKLSVKGNYIMSEYGDTVQLRGMSLFWSQWMPQYYNPDIVKWLRDDWKCTIIRAAMAVEHGGYLEHPDVEKDKIITVVDAAIALGMYVIIDYHSHEAHTQPEAAKKFFGEMAKKYGKYPNVLYEIYNEPKEAPWSEQLKPYAESVIKSIREYDPDNIVIVGTRTWSQMVNEAAEDKIADANTVYTLHYYAASHKQELRDEAKRALDNGVCLFVSEFGTTESSGDGFVDVLESKDWWTFLDQYKISWCNWSVADKQETSAILKMGASPSGGWTEKDLSRSGKLVRAEIIKKNTPILNQKPKAAENSPRK
jgi:endoglucanase